MISKKGLTLLGPQSKFPKVDVTAIKDIFVVYFDSDIMFAGSEDDCATFKTAVSETYPHIQYWKTTTIEEYGSNMWTSGYDTGHGAGYDEADQYWDKGQMS